MSESQFGNAIGNGQPLVPFAPMPLHVNVFVMGSGNAYVNVNGSGQGGGQVSVEAEKTFLQTNLPTVSSTHPQQQEPKTSSRATARETRKPQVLLKRVTSKAGAQGLARWNYKEVDRATTSQTIAVVKCD